MAIKLYSKSQKIYRPLEWTVGFKVSGGTLEQQHDADNNLYYPDRGVTPTLVEPVFHIVDRDAKTSRDATADLINIKWQQVVNGATAVDCTTPDYDVITSTTPEMKKGSIVVNKNVPFLTTITLKFSAEYYDAKRKRTMSVKKDVPLTTASVASLLLHTELDRDSTYIIDPFKLETPAQCIDVISPKFQLGDEMLVDLSVVGGWWYTIENGVETPIDVPNDIRFDKIDPATFALTVDKECIDDVVVRFKSSLHPDKVIPAVAPANANIDDIRLIRKYPEGVTFEQVLLGRGFVNGDATCTVAKVVASGPNGVYSNPDKYWTCDWLIKDSSAGTAYTKVAQGFGPVNLPMKTDAIDIQVAIYEKGAYCEMTDEAGDTIVDDADAIFIAQEERRK